MTTSIDRTKEPPVKGFPPLAIPHPAVTRLPNGIELYALDAGDQPINRITVSYSSGLMETPLPDTLQLAAQLLREGTASYTGSRISETLDYHGAWLKSEALSHNSSVTLWSLNKSTVGLLPLLKEILCSPVFPEKEFMTLRDKHKARYLLSQKNVSYVASQIDKKMVFGEKHPMCRTLNADEIDALTADDIRAAYTLAFSQAPKVFVTGDISEILPEITDFFARLDYTETPDAPLHVMPMNPLHGGKTETCDVDTEHQAAIAISIPTVDRAHPDYIPLRLTVMALGGYFGSRLMTNIREEKGYTYGIQANLLGYREGGVISVLTNTAPQYVEPVIAEVKKEMLRLCDELMPAEELSVVKNNAMTSLAAILDTPFSIMDHHISHFHTGTPPNYFEKQIEAVNALTSTEIMRLAKQYFKMDDMLVSVARPAAGQPS